MTHDRGAVPLHQRGHVPDHQWRKNRLVSLNVDYYVLTVQPQNFPGLRQPVAPRGMVAAGHDGLAAEPFHDVLDARIVSGYIDVAQPLNQTGLLIHPLNQGLSSDIRQSLPRKAGGPVAGRYEGQNTHDRFLLNVIIVRVSDIANRSCLT